MKKFVTISSTFISCEKFLERYKLKGLPKKEMSALNSSKTSEK
jgi:hypothetical protein